MEKMYTTYDGSERYPAGVKDTRTKTQWRAFYETEIDHAIYITFEIWLEEMLRMGILTC